MYLSNLCELAGGQENLTRVTLDDEKLYLTVKDPALLGDSEHPFSLASYNGEWVAETSPLQPVLRDELDAIGSQIDADLRSKAEEFLCPTKCDYRPLWHIAPPQGLLNDPNGFIWHNGEYHLFYQWYPYGCEHKDKYWVLLKSQDMVNWTWSSIALTPSYWFDSHGVFSGHALSHDNELYTFYTGNTRIGPDRLRQATQCCAKLQADGSFKKLGPLIDSLPAGVTPHFRDPKVIRWQDRWIMFIGAQRDDLIGRLAVYHSQDLTNWEYKGLFGDELGEFGYMWECPDVFELDGQYYLIFGPQGISSGNEHHTAPHHNRICKVEIDADGLPHLSDLQVLDYGFDFYAPQSLQTPDGRRVLCAWMGLPDEVNHPSVNNGWIHQLSGLRELKFIDGQLIQAPIKEIAQLRGEKQLLEIDNQGVDLNSKSFELHINLVEGEKLSLFKNADMSFDIEYKNGKLVFNRKNTQVMEGDLIREFSLKNRELAELQIFADRSSLEIFVNKGEAVVTSRVFTPKDATQISCLTINNEAKIAQLYRLNTPSSVYLSKP